MRQQRALGDVAAGAAALAVLRASGEEGWTPSLIPVAPNGGCRPMGSWAQKGPPGTMEAPPGVAMSCPACLVRPCLLCQALPALSGPACLACPLCPTRLCISTPCCCNWHRSRRPLSVNAVSPLQPCTCKKPASRQAGRLARQLMAVGRVGSQCALHAKGVLKLQSDQARWAARLVLLLTQLFRPWSDT